MKTSKFVLVILLFFGCSGPKSSDPDHSGPGSDSTGTNQALYDQVMDIHDEVMPKISDMYMLKKELQDQITAAPDMVIEKRKSLERRIANLDSVSQLMMDWMHHFDPLPDTVDQETKREYLELEMEKIKKVKTAMLEIIQMEKTSK